MGRRQQSKEVPGAGATLIVGGRGGLVAGSHTPVLQPLPTPIPDGTPCREVTGDQGSCRQVSELHSMAGGWGWGVCI